MRQGKAVEQWDAKEAIAAAAVVRRDGESWLGLQRL